MNLRFLTPLIACGAIFAHSTEAIAQQNKKTKPAKPKKKTQSTRTAALTPEEQLGKFKVPDGFVVELVASEENGLINPIDLAFDSAGRLWTGTARMYPLDPVGSVGRRMLADLDKGKFDNNPAFQKMRDLYQRKTKGTDQILIIEDPTQQAQGDLHVFADEMTIPQSFIPYKDGVYVAHGSEMLYLTDQDRDGKADQQEIVLTGFGFTDSHTMSHTLVRGPGGWIHFSHGALNKGLVKAVKSGMEAKIDYSKIARFSLDGEKLEIVNNGWQNIWGFALKANGQWYGTEANDLFFSHAPLHQYMGYKGIGNDRLRPYQPFGGEFHKFKVEGTGISGLAYDENGSRGFPEEYKHAGFLANPITSKINLVLADRAPDGSIISKHLPDFLECEDDWFRPVNIEFGPDGCMYIVDWYNKIVSHNEVDRNHPDRDKSHGRIWRVRHESQVPGKIPNIAKAPNADLIKHLQADILWEKRSAWTEIVDRHATELIPSLVKLAGDSDAPPVTRIHALWSLEGLGHYDESLLQALTKNADADLRREAVRSLVSFQPPVEQIVSLLTPLTEDPHYMVKEEVLRTLKNIGYANADTIKMLVRYAKPQQKKGSENIHAFGDTYEENFQSFLAFMALEEYPTELASFLDSPAAQNLPVANLNEAAKRLPKGARGQKIVEAILSGSSTLDTNTLTSLAPSLNDTTILKALQPQLNSKQFVTTALEALPNLKATDLHKALTPILQTLLASNDASERQLALQAAVSYQLSDLTPAIVQYLQSKSPSHYSLLELQALSLTGQHGHHLQTLIVNDATAPTSTRTHAALALTASNEEIGYQALTSLLSDDKIKTTVISQLKSNSYGMSYLVHALALKLITPDQLTPLDKARFLSVLGKPANGFRKEVVASQIKENKGMTQKIHAVANAYSTKGGNSSTGKLLSASCLACHQIGDQGVNLAPALGGYKDRDPEHLLTAIVHPNAAIEKGYELYRVIQHDGSLTEGFLFNKSDFGTTVATAGGGQTYLPKERIQREFFVSGQSNMPTFSGLLEQQLLDLIAYLKTL